MMNAIPILAEIPAETIIWILAGIVWVVVQLVSRKAGKRIPADPVTGTEDLPDRSRGLRPTGGPDAVSPTDELRRFLQEITGQTTEPEPEKSITHSTHSQRPSPPPVAPGHTAMKPIRATAVHVRSAVAKSAKPIARQTRESATTVVTRRRALPQAFPGDWRQAVIHREILGPPRAMRPYSFDFH